MPFEKITERILQDANSKAEEIKTETRTRVEEVLVQAQDESEKIKSQILRESEISGAEERKRILALTRLEARNSVLSEKQELVELVFERATEKLLSLSDDRYQQFIKNLLLKTAAAGDEEVIICSSDKNRITPDLLNDVNKSLVKEGKKGNLKLAGETRDIGGGFILRSGRIEINSSISSLINSIREEMGIKVLQTLLEE